MSAGEALRSQKFPVFRNEHVFKYHYGRATVRLLVGFDEPDADVVIKVINLQPIEARGRGLGTRALHEFFYWAKAWGFTRVKAVQVQNDEFFIKQGFELCPKPNPSNDYSKTI